MSRAAVLALAAACSAPAASHPVAVAPPAPARVPVAPPLAVPRAAPVVHSDPADGGIEAPAAGVIRIVAAPPDGGAALSIDQRHGARLWPTLDGTHEPRVVELPEAHALALGRRGDGFTAAVLDAAGGLYIATLDAQGRIHSHVSLAADPAWVGIAAATRGLVGWRADQTLVLLDGDGGTLAQLPTEPGERIVSVAVAGERAAVLLDHDGKRGVRTIALAKPAWSAWIDLASQTAELVAVAPSGRIAVRDADRAVVLDASGKLVTELTGAAGEALGFFDDTHLVRQSGSQLAVLAAGASPSTIGTATSPVVTAGGLAIAGAGSDLVIATAAGAKYLGYDVVSPTVAQPAGAGRLVVGQQAKLVTLDARLQVSSSPKLPAATTIPDLRWLGGDAWVVETTTSGTDRTWLQVADADRVSVTRKDLLVAHLLAYEPSTHLLTLSMGEAPSVYRFDPGKHELVRVAEVPGHDVYTQIELFPLAPASGAQLLLVTLRDTTTLAWIPDAAKLARPSATVTFVGSFAAADAAGHAYGWVSGASGKQLAVFRDGKRTTTLPADGPVSVWPEPSGARIVEIATHTVTLVTGDGTRVWTKPLEHASQALWLADGALAIVTGTGIARIDPATGNVTAAHCGWLFGFSATPRPPTPQVETMCEQSERAD